MQSTALQKVANGAPVVAISSQTHDGVTELLRMLRDEVTKYREREAEVVDEKRGRFADNFVGRSGHF